KSTVMVGSGLLNGKFTIDGRLSKLVSDGYIDRAFSDLKSFYLSGAYFGKKSFVRLNVFSGKEKTYQSWYGISESDLLINRRANFYTYENQTDNYQQDHYQCIIPKEQVTMKNTRKPINLPITDYPISPMVLKRLKERI
ncbi:MAG: hypothetical protein MUF58_18355, partial [Arcicella sp.]|nr:hypothetical protein [Arcicella sp.]